MVGCIQARRLARRISLPTPSRTPPPRLPALLSLSWRRRTRRTASTVTTAAKSSNECRSASVRGCPADDGYEEEVVVDGGDDDGDGEGDGVGVGDMTRGRKDPKEEKEAFWSAFFDEMDELEDAIYATKESLAEAVAREAYGEAAALVATCASLEARDTTLEIERAFQAAIEEERYADAAKLRDEGGRRVLGWWVGREGPDDMTGHLVEVRRGVGRYVGVALDPNFSCDRDERDVVGVGENELFEVFYKNCEPLSGLSCGFVSQTTVFDGRMVELLEDDNDDDEEAEEAEEDDDDDDDGIRTVEDLLSMGEEDLLAVIEDEEDEEDEGEQPLGNFHGVDIVRQPAEIEWADRDRFVLRMECSNDLVDSDRIGDDDDNDTPGLEQLEQPEQLERLVLDVGGGKDPIQINYRRLGEAEKDELYLGSFGPHGKEIVHIYTTSIDGKKTIEGRKVTGDVNVPAGELSFRARVDSDNAFRGDDGKYPFEYGVAARYPGQGRVAREGFVEAKWVDGELLRFSPGGKFEGAAWGFVFDVAADKRFLLLFEKLCL